MNYFKLQPRFRCDVQREATVLLKTTMMAPQEVSLDAACTRYIRTGKNNILLVTCSFAVRIIQKKNLSSRNNNPESLIKLTQLAKLMSYDTDTDESKDWFDGMCYVVIVWSPLHFLVTQILEIAVYMLVKLIKR